MVCGGEPGWSCTNDEDALAGWFGVHWHRPAALDRLITEETFHGVDAHGLVELAAVARRFAGPVADPTHHGRQGIVLHDLSPGRLVPAALGMPQPLLDVLAGRAGVVAWRQQIDVHRAFSTPGASLVGQARSDVECDRKGFVVHHGSAFRSCAALPSRSNLRILRSASAWMRAMISVRGCSPNRCA